MRTIAVLLCLALSGTADAQDKARQDVQTALALAIAKRPVHTKVEPVVPQKAPAKGRVEQEKAWEGWQEPSNYQQRVPVRRGIFRGRVSSTSSGNCST